MDPSMILPGGGGADPMAYGLDAGIILAINEMTNYAKEMFEEWQLKEKLNRFYPFLPFVCAYLMCVTLTYDFSAALSEAFKYGLWSMFGWSVFKTSVKGA